MPPVLLPVFLTAPRAYQQSTSCLLVLQSPLHPAQKTVAANSQTVVLAATNMATVGSYPQCVTDTCCSTQQKNSLISTSADQSQEREKERDGRENVDSGETLVPGMFRVL